MKFFLSLAFLASAAWASLVMPNLKNHHEYVLIVGGGKTSGDADVTKKIETFYLFDTSKTCDAVADSPKQIVNSVGSARVGGIGFCGGIDALKSCFSYDTAKKEWAVVDDILLEPRVSAAGRWINEDQFWITGGKPNVGQVMALNSTELFSMDTGTFTKHVSLPEARSGHCVNYLNMTHLLISGGGTAKTLIFDIENEKFTQTQDFPRGAIDIPACAETVFEDKVYVAVIGGRIGNEPQNQVTYFDASAEVWRMDVAQYPEPIMGAAAIGWDSTVVVVGGKGKGQTFYDGIRKLVDDGNNGTEWETISTLGNARAGHSAFVALASDFGCIEATTEKSL